MRSSLVFLLALAACDSQKPELPTTVATPAPSPATVPPPTPEPSTPPPTGYTPPDASTLLRDIPASEWPDLCDALAGEYPAASLTCGDFEIDVPFTSHAELTSLCVDAFGDAASLSGCIATVGDLDAYYELPFDCDLIFDPPPVVDLVTTCVTEDPATPPPTPPPTPPGPTCESVSNQIPADGSVGVFAGTVLSWSFTSVDSSVEVELTGPNGTVAGSGAWSGNTYVWTPANTLAPSTTYDLTLSWCGGTLNAATFFSTGSIGTPTSTSGLAGTNFVVDLASPSAVFLQPAGVGGLIQSQITDLEMLMTVVSASSTDLDLRFGIGTGSGSGVQDICVETFDDSTSFASNPYFDGIDYTIDAGGIPFGPLEMSGAFSPNGDDAVIALQGSIDTRPLVPILTPGGADDEVCNLMAQFGVNCVPCASGGVFCLDMQVENVPAYAAGSPMASITQAQAQANCP